MYNIHDDVINVHRCCIFELTTYNTCKQNTNSLIQCYDVDISFDFKIRIFRNRNKWKYFGLIIIMVCGFQIKKKTGPFNKCITQRTDPAGVPGVHSNNFTLLYLLAVSNYTFKRSPKNINRFRRV